MTDINFVAEQVKRNCDISDAKYVLERGLDEFLRKQIRDLYILETGANPWERFSSKNLSFRSWFKKKKKHWKELKNETFSKIVIDGKEYKITEIEEINRVLNPRNLFYNAAISEGNKISFLLSELLEVKKNNYDVFMLGKDLATDLGNYLFSAFQVGPWIIGRKEALRHLIWRDIKKLTSSQKIPEKDILEEAYEDFGLPKHELLSSPEEIDKKVEKLIPRQMDADLHHELGHFISQKYSIFPPKTFNRLINLTSGTELEWLIIGVDEVLADTQTYQNLKGRLGYIIDQEDKGCLSLLVYMKMKMIRNNSHLRYYGKIFPELFHAYENFRKTGDWNDIEAARKIGEEKAMKLAMQLRESYDIESVKNIHEKLMNEASIPKNTY
jgi:hypothetical protein